MADRASIVVFDIGNVLIEWDPRHLYRKIFTDADRMEWFLTEVCTPDWNLEQDRGRLFADAVALLTKDHGAL
jgi:2-haloacid dehalogenase